MRSSPGERRQLSRVDPELPPSPDRRTARAPFNWRRVLRLAGGFFLAPFVAASFWMILLRWVNPSVSAPDEEDTVPMWILATIVGNVISFVVGVPVFLVYERLGFRGPAQYALGGAVIGLAISAAFVYSTRGSVALSLSAAIGALAFWRYCVRTE
jgi:hypothetical protein